MKNVLAKWLAWLKLGGDRRGHVRGPQRGRLDTRLTAGKDERR